MEIELTEEQMLLRESMHSLLDAETSPERTLELERSGRFDEDLWRQLAAQGWLGLVLPETAGGAGGSLSDLALLSEEMARFAATVPYVETMASALVFSRLPEDVAAGVLAGTAILAPAVLDERDSFGAASGSVNGAFSGTRKFVDYGQFATHFVVRAGEDLHLVPAEGAQVSALQTISRVPMANVTFTGARILATAAMPAAQHLDVTMRALAAVQCLGYAEYALDTTVEYVKNRVQFGRPLGSFQAVQHHCADMATQVEAARYLCREAIWSMENGSTTPDQVATAKAWASIAAIEVTALAHQLHGGIGVTEEYPLQLYSRRARDRATAWGTSDECLEVVGSGLTARVDWL